LAWAVKRGLPSTRVRARRWIQVAGLDDWRLPSRPDGDVYDSTTAAAFLGIGRGAFQRLANRTALPYKLVASRRWYDAADIAGLIEQSRIVLGPPLAGAVSLRRMVVAKVTYRQP
jgi:hypothetical protein